MVQATHIESRDFDAVRPRAKENPLSNVKTSVRRRRNTLQF